MLARATEHHTGAGIGAIFVAALHDAFARGKELTGKHIVNAMADMVPLAQLMDGQIATLRHWAKVRAREAASRNAASRRPSCRISDQN